MVKMIGCFLCKRGRNTPASVCRINGFQYLVIHSEFIRMQKEKIEKILASLALEDYRWTDPEKIVVAQWVRVKCLFGCADYGLGA